MRRVLPALLLFCIDGGRDDKLRAGLLETTWIVTVVILFSWVECRNSLVLLELLKYFFLSVSRLEKDVLYFIKLLVGVRLNFC
jgi:hypothetical protein